MQFRLSSEAGEEINFKADFPLEYGVYIIRGLPFSTYAARGREDVKEMTNFCVRQY